MAHYEKPLKQQRDWTYVVEDWPDEEAERLEKERGRCGGGVASEAPMDPKFMAGEFFLFM